MDTIHDVSDGQDRGQNEERAPLGSDLPTRSEKARGHARVHGRVGM